MLSDVTDFLTSGGPVLYGILLISIILWILILDRYWFFTRESQTLCRQQQDKWQSLESHETWHALKIRNQLVSQTQIEFERYRSVIQLLVVICPLMGLLGTVTGMINVFDVMAITGTGNARAMASGISMATVPTMAGMVVSLVGLYFKTRFDGMAKKQLDIFKDRLLK
ncbi:MAG: MotA/TolQ/ExbB proton channel family protein [Gammaproteobacteria bacterium]|nr:MotA/TolQ/ExbB proton channel family protein [Gammaproteobacteria bacterium]